LTNRPVKQQTGGKDILSTLLILLRTVYPPQSALYIESQFLAVALLLILRLCHSMLCTVVY